MLTAGFCPILNERVQPTSPARTLVIVVVTHGAIEPLGSGIRPQPLDGAGIRRPDNTTLSKSLEGCIRATYSLTASFPKMSCEKCGYTV